MEHTCKGSALDPPLINKKREESYFIFHPAQIKVHCFLSAFSGALIFYHYCNQIPPSYPITHLSCH